MATSQRATLLFAAAANASGAEEKIFEVALIWAVLVHRICWRYWSGCGAGRDRRREGEGEYEKESDCVSE